MSDTALRPDGTNGTTPSLRLGMSGRRVQVPWVVLGILLITGCALAFGVTTQQLSRRVPVVALARPVARGAVIAPADLTVARVAVDPGVPLIAAPDAAGLPGRVARTALPAGALLLPDLLGPAGVDQGPDRRTVGLALAPGEYPVGALAAGDVVDVIATDGDGDVIAAAATIAEVRRPDDGGATQLVSVVVDERVAAGVAAAAARGAVRLVLRGSG